MSGGGDLYEGSDKLYKMKINVLNLVIFEEVERRGEGETGKGTVVHAYIPEK
jgi:hypothetical protein